MGTFRGGIFALAVLTEAVALTVPAVADGSLGAAYFDRANYLSVWQGLYRGVNLGWGWSGDDLAAANHSDMIQGIVTR
jgi:hypothetical protein